MQSPGMHVFGKLQTSPTPPVHCVLLVHALRPTEHVPPPQLAGLEHVICGLFEHRIEQLASLKHENPLTLHAPGTHTFDAQPAFD